MLLNIDLVPYKLVKMDFLVNTLMNVIWKKRDTKITIKIYLCPRMNPAFKQEIQIEQKEV